jgi:GntR family transcriptional regulator
MAQPMYRQIADDLRGRIEAGELSQGAPLPTESDLREQYDASRNTIRDAIKRLTSIGLVETKAGQGTFVVQKIDPFVTTLTADPDTGRSGGEGAQYLSEVSGQHRRPMASVPRVEIQVPDSEIALRLRIAPGIQVISRHQKRFIDDLPWSLQTSFYPMDFVTRGNSHRLLMAEDIPDGAVRYLEETTGIKQVGYRDWITARTPDSSEQAFFRILHDSTIFEIFRTSFDQSGKPMRLTVTVFPADRNQFIVNVGTVPDPQYEVPEERGSGLESPPEINPGEDHKPSLPPIRIG